jgi:hypothetical protein
VDDRHRQQRTELSRSLPAIDRRPAPPHAQVSSLAAPSACADWWGSAQVQIGGCRPARVVGTHRHLACIYHV